METEYYAFLHPLNFSKTLFINLFVHANFFPRSLLKLIRLFEQDERTSNLFLLKKVTEKYQRIKRILSK